MADKYLGRVLRRTPEGGALPPIRAMIEANELGRVVISAALDRAEARGWVRREPRRGVFRAELPPLRETVPAIDFVACAGNVEHGSPGSFVEELIAAIGAALTRRGLALRVHQATVGDSFDAHRAIAERPEVRACFLFGPHAKELVNCFERRQVTTLPLFPRIEPERLGHGIFGPKNLVDLLMKHLAAAGHTRIGFLERAYPHLPSSLSTLRRAEYYRHMAERGLRVAPHWVAETGFDEASIRSALQTIVWQEPRPSAVILPTAAMPTAYRLAEETGLRVGVDLALAGIDHARVAENLLPAPTCAGVVHPETAELAVDSLLDLLEGGSGNGKYAAPLRLTTGGSTATRTDAPDRGDGFRDIGDTSALTTSTLAAGASLAPAAQPRNHNQKEPKPCNT